MKIRGEHIAGNLLKAWMGIKETTLVAYRLAEKYEVQLRQETKDLDLVSILVSTIPIYSKAALGCKTVALTVLEHVALENPRLYDLPPSRQMAPLGYGTSFRFGEISQVCDFLGVIIEQVLLKNDDILMLEDTLPVTLSATFYTENRELIGKAVGEASELLEATGRGEFGKLFTKFSREERHGKSKYVAEPLMLYGYYNDQAGRHYFAGNPDGYDLKFRGDPARDLFSEYFPRGDCRVVFFDIVDMMQNIDNEMHASRENISPSHLLLLALARDHALFLAVDCIQAAARGGEQNGHLGILLQLMADEQGANLGKLAYKVNLLLGENLEKFRRGGSVSECLAIEHEIKSLHLSP